MTSRKEIFDEFNNKTCSDMGTICDLCDKWVPSWVTLISRHTLDRYDLCEQCFVGEKDHD